MKFSVGTQLLLGCFCLFDIKPIDSSSPPVFSTEDIVHVVSAREGGHAVLPCVVEDPRGLSVQWSYKNRLLSIGTHSYDRRWRVDKPYPTEWNLMAEKVFVNDQGLYYCKLAGSNIVSTVRLEIQIPPIILDEFSSKNVSAMEGDSPTLWCNVTGIPYPFVKWYKLMGTSVRAPRRYTGVNGEWLTLNNITRYADGIYICVAKNTVDSVEREVTMNVLFEPEVSMMQTSVQARKTQDATLVCAVQANPMIDDVFWTMGDNIEHLPGNFKYAMFMDHELVPEFKLRFHLMTIHALEDRDFSIYKCKARRSDGSVVEAVVNLLKIPEPRQTTRDPDIIRYEV